MYLDISYGSLSDKCCDCPFCLARDHNRDQKCCIVTGFIVNPSLHDYRCPATFERVGEPIDT